jgi:hypothetical protein
LELFYSNVLDFVGISRPSILVAGAFTEESSTFSYIITAPIVLFLPFGGSILSPPGFIFLLSKKDIYSYPTNRSARGVLRESTAPSSSNSI